MTKPERTIASIKQSPKLNTSEFRVSDFLNKEQTDEIKRNNLYGKTAKKRKFDEVDSFCAEMIAYFGYEFYKDWNAGLIPNSKATRMIHAERSRRKSEMVSFEALVFGVVASCIQLKKGQKKPNGLKLAQKIMKEEIRIAKGGN